MFFNFQPFILAGIAATSLTLSSLIVIPCAVYVMRSRKKFVLWALVVIIPALAFTTLQLSGIFSNHYAGLSGWIDISIDQVLIQLQLHKDTII